jgi:hypothetical protein
LLKRIADAGQLKRALFLCDCDELRTQGLKAMQGVFGADAAEVYEEEGGRNHAKNARVLKAVNPNRKVDVDRRTPIELLDLIDAKGREVAEAVALLRSLTSRA